MCGICGFYGHENRALIKKMTDVLQHRGPDDSGIFTAKNICLGQRRLSIIDLSAKGKQPMCNEDESIWVTYNGEIYNFAGLREELEQKGHKFKSDTDTEVIIHAYEEYGESCVEKFNGMFAFAIWDSNQKKLFIARDRLGIKPIYYYWDKAHFIFASEIKAILLHPEVQRKVNLTTAYSYLDFRYVPGENTLFSGINKLLPGNTLTLHKKDLTIKEYWDVPIPIIKKEKNSSQKVLDFLTESVKKRLVADVPVGVYLSGGLDSASLVAIASKLKNSPVKTFSVGFNYDDAVDELNKANIISRHFNTDHHEIVVDEEIGDLLPKLLWHLDMPHGDPVIIPMFKLSCAASKKVKVVLSGEGADETFAGYVQYKTLLTARNAKYIPSPLTKLATSLTPIGVFDKLFDYPSSIGTKGKEKILDLVSDINDERSSYLHLVTILSNSDRELLFSKNVPNYNDKAFFQQNRKPFLNRMLYYDTKTWLPNYVLYINDRMTMANSIEGRVPFLDHNLVEYTTTLPSKQKINGKVNKYILRQAMNKLLPKHISSVKKHAFFMPLDKWYEEELKDLAQELFTPETVKKRGYFNYDGLKKVWENYHSSKLLYGKQLFTLINFELWHRMFIDKEELPKKDMKLYSLL